MNSLCFTFQADSALRLPLAYNALVQGALYAAWRERFPELHDIGFGDGTRRFRFFTFGPLRGAYKVEGKEILFRGRVTLEVRSSSPDLMEALAAYYLGRGYLRLGHRELPLTGLETADRLLFFSTARIDMLSPVTVHETLAEGRTVCYAPDAERFLPLLTGNLDAKLRAAEMSAPPVLGLRPQKSTLRKRVTLFKGIYITGYMGSFELEADPEVIALLYYTGLGDRNSQGFGMFRIQ